MNSHENEREEQLNQARSHASRDKFLYSHEKVDRVDIRSLDRVWERLEEHVSRNSAAYENNKNLPTFQQNGNEHGVKKASPALSPHKRQAFQQRLGTLVAVLLLTALIGSLVLVLQAAHHADTTTGTPGNIQGTTLPAKGTTKGKQTISIIEKNGVSRFMASKLVTPVGGAIILHNQTSIEQVVLSASNHQTITIASNDSVVLVYKQAEICIWYLQSNPQAQVAIVVGNVSQQTADAPQCYFQINSSPG